MENSNVLHIPDPSYYPLQLSPAEAVCFPQDNIFIICMKIRDFLFHRTLLCFMRPMPIIHGNTSGLE